ASPESRTPSPHPAFLQLGRQASGRVAELEEPSSQSSTPSSTSPSPQRAFLHSPVQAPLSSLVLVSHSSPVSITWSPQLASLQRVRQASAAVSLLAAPLSQASPSSLTPSPQRGREQSTRQALGLSLSFWSPSSQPSPVSVTPSPQRAAVQSVRQASGRVSL